MLSRETGSVTQSRVHQREGKKRVGCCIFNSRYVCLKAKIKQQRSLRQGTQSSSSYLLGFLIADVGPAQHGSLHCGQDFELGAYSWDSLTHLKRKFHLVFVSCLAHKFLEGRYTQLHSQSLACRTTQ